MAAATRSQASLINAEIVAQPSENSDAASLLKLAQAVDIVLENKLHGRRIDGENTMPVVR